MVDNKPNSEILAETHPNHLSSINNRARIILAISVFVPAFALYLYTLAPTVTLVDSGELILAARTLGVAHPPGFPLYVLLAHLFSLLPLGNIATRIHVVSAIFAALASAILTLALFEALQTPLQSISKSKAKSSSRKRSKATGKDLEPDFEKPSSPTLIFAPAILAGMLFAFSRTLWAYATIAEVYTLNAFLFITIVWLMISWRKEAIDAKANRTTLSDRKLLIAAWVFGLALGVHHVTIGLLLPGLAAMVFVTEGLAFFKSKRLLIAALVSITGLGIYIYLPVAASRSPLMNWGKPSTLESFWWHVTGKQYQVFFDLSFSRISEFFKLVFREFSPSWFPFALFISLAGFVHLFKRDKALFLLLALTIIADVFYGLGYEIAEDKDAYYLPAFIALVIAFGFGIRESLTLITKLIAVLKPIHIAGTFLLIPLIALVSNFSFNNRSSYFIAHDYVDNIFKTVAPNALLLTNDWQVYSPTLYVREIEQQRKDMVVIDINQLRRWWYFDYLKQVYPDLINNSREKVDAFLEDLINWERHPDLYAKDVTLNKRINDRFYEMIFSFIANHIKNAPVYVTQEIALRQSGQDAELAQGLNEKYKIIPQGLVFRIAQEATLAESEKPQLNTRGLADGTLRFEEDDVVKKKVFPVYVSMFINNGRYWALQNQHEKAIDWYKEALAVDPNNQAAKNYFSASQNALQKPGATK